ETGDGVLTLTEQHLYGAGRIGMRKRNLALGGGAEEPATPATHYELTNHLGNVLAVISDAPSDGAQPTVESLTDYYPFGMAMPGRSYVRNGGGYRYGYTGHEKEGGLADGVYTTQYRLLDTRLGRWLSVDPLFEEYCNESPYSYCGGNPVSMLDSDGRIKIVYFTQIRKSLNKDPEYDRNRSLLAYAHGTLKDVSDISIFVGHGVTVGGKQGAKIRLANPQYTGQTWIDYTPSLFGEYYLNLSKNLPSIVKSSYAEIIVLVSCNTGKGGENSFAAQVSSKTYSIVIAPSDVVEVNNSTQQTRVLNDGKWNIFIDGKKVDEFSGDIQLNDYLNAETRKKLSEKYEEYIPVFTVEVNNKSGNEKKEQKKTKTIK
ncbi:MAG: hypothetical protein MJZ11_14110, partial [Lachnospiraceae bacterium]|nr:hypothetical protein [Lachnospiraceae bacterium]